jgi:hypothetical protein
MRALIVLPLLLAASPLRAPDSAPCESCAFTPSVQELIPARTLTVTAVGETPCSDRTNAIFHAIRELRLPAEEHPAGGTSFYYDPGPPCGPPP